MLINDTITRATVEVRSQDCDGPYSTAYEFLRGPQEDAMAFVSHIWGIEYPMVAEGEPSVAVNVTAHGFWWSRATDEGYESHEVTFHTDTEA